MDETTAVTIAKNKKSTADQLFPLLNISDQVNRLLAKHPNSTSEILNELGMSLDDKTVALVAEHPNVPIGMLNNLGDYHPSSMFKNPALPNILRQNKSYLGLFFGDAFEKALKSNNVPDFVVDSLAKNGTFEHQAIFLFGGKRNSETFAKFYSSKHPKILAQLLAREDSLYLIWARDVGYLGSGNIEVAGKSTRQEIDDWVDQFSQRISELYKTLVPAQGVSDTLQGELVRALSRIESEYYKNGMMNWGDGSKFYENLSELIHKTLKSEPEFSGLVKSIIDSDISEIKESGQNGKAMATGKKRREDAFGGNFLIQTDVEKSHSRLGALIVIWCERHPELIPYSPT